MENFLMPELQFGRFCGACFRRVFVALLFGQLFRTIGAQNVVSDLTTANGFEWRASLANGSEH